MLDLILGTLMASVHAAPAGFGGPAGIWDSIVNDFSNITEPAAFSAFLQVLMIDLVLAGDNAIVVGALAAGLPADQRKKVIFIGDCAECGDIRIAQMIANEEERRLGRRADDLYIHARDLGKADGPPAKSHLAPIDPVRNEQVDDPP